MNTENNAAMPYEDPKPNDFHYITKKLAIAIEALKKVADVNYNKEPGTDRTLPHYELRAIAREALNTIVND